MKEIIVKNLLNVRNWKLDVINFDDKTIVNRIADLKTKFIYTDERYKINNQIIYKSIKNYPDYTYAVSEYITFLFLSRKVNNYHAIPPKLARPFWLAENLGNAFLNTNFPGQIQGFNIVASEFFLLLPKGLVTHCGVDITWVKVYHSLDVNNNHRFCWQTYDSFTGTKFALDMIPFEKTTTLSYIFTVENSDKTVNIYGNTGFVLDDDHLDVEKITIISDYTEEQQQTINTISNLILQFVLYMNLKKIEVPSLPTGKQPIGFGNTTKTRKPLIPPLMIGADYQLKRVRESDRNSDASGSGSKVKTHWRSGHWRNQAYGSRDNFQHKLMWIEPILVNG